MKSFILKSTLILSALLLLSSINYESENQEFQGVAYYFSKTPMDLGRWGARMNEQQKKQIAERLKNRLEKTYILTFNTYESIYKEDQKLDAMSGATDSWGKAFTPGNQYKNIKTKTFLQDQEFYGKRFLVKDEIQSLKWELSSETKKIGQYTCYKATVVRPKDEVAWWSFSWNNLRARNNKAVDSVEVKDQSETNKSFENIELLEIVAWYTPQIPVSQGPSEYWGLPGLILEINEGNTTILCSKIVMNSKDKLEIKAPSRGEEVTRNEYSEIILNKMKDFRNNRMGRRPRR